MANELSAPFFTIGIPNYERPQYLREALQSILAQSFTDFEVIVSDDCSQADIASVISEFADPRLRWVRQKKNLGAVANFNYVIGQARGRYIVFHQNDDLLHQDFLLRAYEAFQRNPDAVLYASCFWTGDIQQGFHARTDIQADKAADILAGGPFLLDGNLFCARLLVSFPITFPAIAISAEHWHAVGDYFADYELGADQITLCRVLIGGTLLYDARIGGIYRAHAAQTSRSSAKKDKKHFHKLTLQQMVSDLERQQVPWEELLRSYAQQATSAELIAMLRESLIFQADPRLIKSLINVLSQRQQLSRASQFIKLAKKIRIRGLIYLLACLLKKK